MGKLRWRPIVRRLHGWIALATGAVLLVIVLSGSVLLLDPEIQRLLKPELYESTPSEHPVGPGQALHAVEREDNGFEASAVVRNRGVYEVWDADFLNQAHVDPGTGRVLGVASHDTGVMGFLTNLHTCGLSCKDYPGYLPFLKAKVQVLGNKLTVGELILASVAMVLLVLVVSGLFLWWPGIKRMARGFVVRRRRGTYATSYDLHKVFGFAALPFLAMWAITGAGFELKQVEDAWYALMPGDKPREALPPFESSRGEGHVGYRQAERSAERAVPGSEAISIGPPTGRKGYYDVWVANGWDPYEHSVWPGNTEVAVDRYDGDRTKVLWGDSANQPMGELVWEQWSYPVHAGTPVGWAPRLAWLGFGLTPLLLAVTGTTVWWIRRRKRRRKLATVPRSAES